jgi:hypothetical protein
VNDIHVYSIETFEFIFLHNYYYQIMTHEVCYVVISIEHYNFRFILFFFISLCNSNILCSWN